MIATVTTPPQQAIDQLLRREGLEQQALGALMQDGKDEHLKAKWMRICQENLDIVTDFVKEYGWPSQRKYGLNVETAAFLMVQHGDANTALDKQSLVQATQKQAALLNVMQEEVTPGFAAFVTDRVLRNIGKPQRFGTQFYPRNVIDNIEDPAHLDERRLVVGLGETHTQYLTRIEAGDKLPFRKLIEHDTGVLAKFEHTSSQLHKTTPSTQETDTMQPETTWWKPLIIGGAAAAVVFGVAVAISEVVGVAAITAAVVTGAIGAIGTYAMEPHREKMLVKEASIKIASSEREKDLAHEKAMQPMPERMTYRDDFAVREMARKAAQEHRALGV